jgi:Holliday junction resolvase
MLETDGWVVIRAAGSLGIDLVAARDGTCRWPGTERWAHLHNALLFIEVKSTAGGPFERFGPGERSQLLELADIAGADALLAWWPPKGELRWIASEEWPRAEKRQRPPLTGGVGSSA